MSELESSKHTSKNPDTKERFVIPFCVLLKAEDLARYEEHGNFVLRVSHALIAREENERIISTLRKTKEVY